MGTHQQAPGEQQGFCALNVLHFGFTEAWRGRKGMRKQRREAERVRKGG